VAKPNGRDPTSAELLISLADAAELFHTPDGTCYADIEVNGHRETWDINRQGFRSWLTRRFYEATKSAHSADAMQSALGLLTAKARYDAPERNVSLRVGSHEGRLYLDLCNGAWEVVEIDATGWRIIHNPPVRFRREAAAKPLPIPEYGGKINELHPFLNIKSEDDFVMAVAWMLAALREQGPYPVLAVSGEQGSAKSTFTAVIRSLTDPNTAPLRALPREEREFFIAAGNAHVLAFDNVSGLSNWISDTLCRIATGAAFSARALYTNQDEILFRVTRPMILNGIEDMITRPDLGDRALLLTLEPIAEGTRRPEQELWADFAQAAPRILGALLDGVVMGLRRLPHTKLEKMPRLADFAKWATACETAYWPAGTFARAYDQNRAAAVADMIENNAVARAIRNLMVKAPTWSGTATDLLKALALWSTGDRHWPANPRALSSQFQRIAPALRNIGIAVDFSRQGHEGTRVIHISSTSKKGKDHDNLQRD
jgi:hypothetical protein